MAETVVALGAILTMLYGTFEVGLIGLTQLSSDGAAFVAAHASVMGNNPAAAIASPFPMLAAAGGVSDPATTVLTISTSAPDAVSEPVDYQISNESNRHGGAQVVRPSHTQASVTQTSVGIIAANPIIPLLSGGSGFIEGNETVSDDGFDLAGTSLNSAAGEAGEVNYFSDDGNAPPYFIGFRYLFHCFNLNYGAACNNTNVEQMDAVGLAEYLDGTNWAMPVNGTNSPNAVFYAMLLHEQVYAKLGNVLNGIAATPLAFVPQKYSLGSNNTFYLTYAQMLLNPKPTPAQSGATPVLPIVGASILSSYPTPPPPSPCLENVDSWDIKIPPGYKIGTTQIGSYPLNTTNSVAGC